MHGDLDVFAGERFADGDGFALPHVDPPAEGVLEAVQTLVVHIFCRLFGVFVSRGIKFFVVAARAEFDHDPSSRFSCTGANTVICVPVSCIRMSFGIRNIFAVT